MAEFDFRQFVPNPNQYPNGTLPLSPREMGILASVGVKNEAMPFVLGPDITLREDFQNGWRRGSVAAFAGLSAIEELIGEAA